MRRTQSEVEAKRAREICEGLERFPAALCRMVKRYEGVYLCCLVDDINSVLTRRDQIFVCEHCNRVVLSEPSYLSTSKWGHERPFCGGCARACPDAGCDESPYAPSMSYRHEQCRESAPSAEAQEEEREQEQEEGRRKKKPKVGNAFGL